MKLTVLLMIACLLGGCKSHKKMAEKKEENVFQMIPKQVFNLELTSCYGTCPAYKVAIFDNDSLVYEGVQYVAKQEKITKKLPKGTVYQLVEKFREADFFGFQNQYTSNISDFPTTYISFTDKGITKKIMDYYKAPERLKQLEVLIGNLVKDEVEIKN